MRDVAQTSGFSPATVSIVLNNAPLAQYIAPATKKKIEEAARKPGKVVRNHGDFTAGVAGAARRVEAE